MHERSLRGQLVSTHGSSDDVADDAQSLLDEFNTEAQASLHSPFVPSPSSLVEHGEAEKEALQQ